MSNQTQTSNMVVAALLLAVGMAIAGFFISQTLYKSKVALNIAEVKGLAEKRVDADTAYWLIQYTVTGRDKTEIPSLYRQSEANQKKIVALLKQSGFSTEEISPGVISYKKDEFRDDNQNLVDEKHLLIGTIEVQTNQVKLVSKVRADLNALIAQGLDIENNPPKYYFTKLNSIKPQMLKEATQNARVAAKEFAENAGVNVGGIRSARQGGFNVRDVGQDYGDTNKIEKDVRVVTTITFFLTD